MAPPQSAAIPYFLSNKDVAVEAVSGSRVLALELELVAWLARPPQVTGSGKTLAFAVPVAEILQR